MCIISEQYFFKFKNKPWPGRAFETSHDQWTKNLDMGLSSLTQYTLEEKSYKFSALITLGYEIALQTNKYVCPFLAMVAFKKKWQVVWLSKTITQMFTTTGTMNFIKVKG